ncbi:hypothetical protein [uncultured Erythrobacter sp.]|uniref:hypothetical protein n=1 Tax=uncultured Erythrobacter sp. TaxID=263913 RepID=UPI0026317DC9|nr:hypothetical protein [uncultured Erythrobacter sp.]
MPYTPFTRNEVKRIFQLSEQGRGHAGERHVNITNQGMAERQMGTHERSGISDVTSFVKFDDQIDAALALLNAPANDAALERFRVEKKQGRGYSGGGGRYVELTHTLNAPVLMRYAIGGTTRTFPCRRVKMIIDKCNGRPRNIHIVTFFGEFGG